MKWFLILFLIACSPTEEFVSSVNGDYLIEIQPTAKFLDWISMNTYRNMYFNKAIIQAETIWNPNAISPKQSIILDLDDDPNSTCIKDSFSAWSIPGQKYIYYCPSFIFCDRENKDLYGYSGCYLSLLHELGHVLGARNHISQNNRPLHLSGPIMCGWHSDCIDPLLTDYTDEDVKFICGDGGIGGRCNRR